jgi:hypothetical protein
LAFSDFFLKNVQILAMGKTESMTFFTLGMLDVTQ